MKGQKRFSLLAFQNTFKLLCASGLFSAMAIQLHVIVLVEHARTEDCQEHTPLVEEGTNFSWPRHLHLLNSINDALWHTQHQSTIYKSVGPVSAKYTRSFTRGVLIIPINKHYRGSTSGPAGLVLA